MVLVDDAVVAAGLVALLTMLRYFRPGNFRRIASFPWGHRGHAQVRTDTPGVSRAPPPHQHDRQFGGMLELLPFAVLVTDEDGRIVQANAATAALFGYTPEELLNVHADVLIPPWQPHCDRGHPDDTSSARPVRAVYGACDRLARRKDGTDFLAEVTTHPISSDGGAETLTVVIDRTDRYELLRHRQELAHLTRVSTLGELAGSLAHELNQPLTAILSNAQAAQRFMAAQPSNLEEVREILKDLVKDNHRASEVLRKIRLLVKKGEPEVVVLSMESVIADVALLVHSDAIGRGIRMYLDISPELPPAYGDRVQLEQVLLNLLLNAFEALASRAPHDRVVMIEAAPDSARMIRVVVRDRGPGLAGDQIHKLFMPYFTSKREGLGLGLSISRSIVEMHGGRIWAENNDDQGAAFCFTLPVGVAADPTHSGPPS
ncbi:two-component system sensor histidine kinase NtrB [Bordetella sp. H567]|uniref:two-component system sensor histidine kinase NtrB n=1 Tax=Bordetella sp. H567 TaxID=1697043 RepID=UPI0009F56847|nr:ATP-binding protein [Bordetella sp. H567]